MSVNGKGREGKRREGKGARWLMSSLWIICYSNLILVRAFKTRLVSDAETNLPILSIVSEKGPITLVCMNFVPDIMGRKALQNG